MVKILVIEDNEQNMYLFEFLLEKHGFTTAQGHLEQAIAAHTRGGWASATLGPLVKRRRPCRLTGEGTVLMLPAHFRDRNQGNG